MQKPCYTTKQRKGYGKGEGVNYKPYILTRESNSVGTTAILNDYKNGRQVHLLSQAELKWFYVLRWNDNNVDVREQFPLDMKLVSKVAEDFGYYVDNSTQNFWTTDFLVTESNGNYHAYSVK